MLIGWYVHGRSFLVFESVLHLIQNRITFCKSAAICYHLRLADVKVDISVLAPGIADVDLIKENPHILIRNQTHNKTVVSKPDDAGRAGSGHTATGVPSVCRWLRVQTQGRSTLRVKVVETTTIYAPCFFISKINYVVGFKIKPSKCPGK